MSKEKYCRLCKDTLSQSRGLCRLCLQGGECDCGRLKTFKDFVGKGVELDYRIYTCKNCDFKFKCKLCGKKLLKKDNCWECQQRSKECNSRKKGAKIMFEIIRGEIDLDFRSEEN